MKKLLKKYSLVVTIDILAIVAFALRIGTDEKIELVLFVMELVLLNIVVLVDSIWGERYGSLMQLLEKTVGILVAISFFVVIIL